VNWLPTKRFHSRYSMSNRFVYYTKPSYFGVIFLSFFNFIRFISKGRRYRFRLISNGFLNCPIQLSVDNHTLLVIASDGNDIQPIEGIVVKSNDLYLQNKPT
jgi:hypothetical protein